jgi:hypothetical protein
MRWTPAEADPSSAEAARAKLVFMMSRTRSEDGQSDNENENERREENRMLWYDTTMKPCCLESQGAHMQMKLEGWFGVGCHDEAGAGAWLKKDQSENGGWSHFQLCEKSNPKNQAWHYRSSTESTMVVGEPGTITSTPTSASILS